MSPPPARSTFRSAVRERALDVAHELVVEVGWDRVRLSEVAARAGVSRPTLYKELGDKQGLGEALVLREAEGFLVGIEEVLAQVWDPAGEGVAAAVAYTLDRATRSPLLRSVLTAPRADARGGPVGDRPAPPGGVLPLLSTSASLLELATGRLGSWLADHFPDAGADDVTAATDAAVRLTVSHLVLPAPDSAATPHRIAEVATRYLHAPR